MSIRPLLVLLTLLLAFAAGAETFIIQDGQPMAEIIVEQDAPRTTRLAAQDLQHYLHKISGATLPIVHQPGYYLQVKLYVGESAATRDLGITADGLRDGAYRLVSGDNWLVFIGDDTDFVPIEPWPRSPAEVRSGDLYKPWDKVSGTTWGHPLTLIYKNYTGDARRFGQPQPEGAPIEFWEFDEAGSYNAVCGFLRSLGVRWYMPGEVGEVVPTRTTIALPEIDQTVTPALPVRRFATSYRVQGRDVALWHLRLGVRNPYDLETAHGLNTIFKRPEMMAAHPEYYALFAGQRNNDPESRYNHLCLSEQGVLDETVRYARTLFDHYDMSVVSAMPTDALDALCQCEKCAGKDTPERGSRGRLSDYIWGFVNQVAAETAKTHPDKKIICCAYGSYTLPPIHLDKLHPNVLVCIVGGRRPLSNDRDYTRQLQDGWRALTDNKLLIFENYPFTHRGYFLPAFNARQLGRTINETKPWSMGEDIWLSYVSTFDAPGYNHFPVYFTARMYWGDENQDAGAMLEEYCRLFYGPAAAEMLAFFEYCEENWQNAYEDEATFNRLFALFDAAKAKAKPDSVYGQRIAIVEDYLNRLREKGVKLDAVTARGDGPVVTLQTVDSELTIDGTFDEPAWQNATTHSLRELIEGGEPQHATTFKMLFGNENLYIAIRCEDEGELNIGTTRNEDPALWYGDVVELLLETDYHSYYQIAISPTGALVDLDRATGQGYEWGSLADVKTQIDDHGWSAEIRLPVVVDTSDPLHQVIGHTPTPDRPWYFNLCRQRYRDNTYQWSAFNPTGKNFHILEKFAKLQLPND